MRKRKTNIRNTVTPDPIDFYMEIKESKANQSYVYINVCKMKEKNEFRYTKKVRGNELGLANE